MAAGAARAVAQTTWDLTQATGSVDPSRGLSDDAFPDSFGEHRGPDGRLRPGYHELFGALAKLDLGGLAADVAGRLQERGVTFGEATFVVDPVPRLFSGAEWDSVSAGLAQRTRALNRFLLDAYGERRIVRTDLIAAAAIDEAEGFEPDLLGRLPGEAAPAAIIGFDVVREPGGRACSCSRTTCARRRASPTRSRRAKR